MDIEEELLEEELDITDIQDTPEEISTAQKRAEALLTAILDYKRPLNQKDTLSSQNTSVLNRIYARDRELNTCIQSWIQRGEISECSPSIQQFLRSLEENPLIGNPAVWSVPARIVLANRVEQVLKKYHFTDSLEHINTLMKNTNQQLE
jgi:hypothetical protein